MRKIGDRHEIVAGERRWRAAQRAGLLRVPVSFETFRDEKLLEIALIENIQREDLNPIEEAQAYRRLTDELHLSQEEIAGRRRQGPRDRRQLHAPAPASGRSAQRSGSGALSMGHARALLALPDENAQRRVARDWSRGRFGSRNRSARPPRACAARTPARTASVDANTRAAEEKLKIALGTRVRIVRKGKGGRIEVDFKDEDELNRIYEALTGQ